MLFAEKVQKARLKLFMSQEALAKELSVSFATVNRWEKGHYEATQLIRRRFDDLCKKHDIKFEE